MRAGHAFTLFLALTVVAPLALAQDETPTPPEHGEMPAPPPPPQDAYLDARVGTWQGTGTMMGMPMTETVTADWQLGHYFFAHRSTIAMTLPDGQEMPMEMHMISKVNGDGTYTGIYMDSMGSMGEYTGRLDESGNMVTEWTDPMHGGNHRGVESATAGDGWTMQFLSQEADGTWAESGSMSYTRIAE